MTSLLKMMSSFCQQWIYVIHSKSSHTYWIYIEFLIPYSEQKLKLSGHFLSKQKSKREPKATLSFLGNTKPSSQALEHWTESSPTVSSHWHCQGRRCWLGDTMTAMPQCQPPLLAMDLFQCSPKPQTGWVGSPPTEYFKGLNEKTDFIDFETGGYWKKPHLLQSPALFIGIESKFRIEDQDCHSQNRD